MLLSTIGSLKTGTYTVTRTANGTTTLGRYTSGASSTFPIVAVVQPYQGGRKMLPLPEGVRAEETKLLHTATELRTHDNDGEADSIVILGDTYVVFAVEGPFTLGASTHFEVYAARRTIP